MSEIHLFANDVGEFFAELDNSVQILKEYFLIFLHYSLLTM